MKIPVFQLINFVIILVVLVFLVWYVWDLFFGKGYSPVEWEHLRKQGKIGKKLLQLEKNYKDKIRFFNWWLQVERLKKENVPGDFAEVGVYQGEVLIYFIIWIPAGDFTCLIPSPACQRVTWSMRRVKLQLILPTGLLIRMLTMFFTRYREITIS